MKHITEGLRPGHRVARRLALGLAAVLAGSASGLLLTAPATASPVPAVTGVQIANAPPLMTDTPYTIEATWAVDDVVTAGDTFELDFPAALTGYAATFALRDTEDAEVGTCVVSSSSFLCTLGDYVDTHTDVNGTLHFQARFTEAVEEEEVVFIADNDTTVAMATPGGVADSTGDVPQEPQKWGSVYADGKSMTWALTVPAEFLAAAGGEPVTIVDVYDEALTFDPTAMSARWSYDSDWGDEVWHDVSQGTGPGTYSVVADESTNTFAVTFIAPVTSDDRFYQFLTEMDFPAGVQDGEAFGNTMTVADRTVTARPVQYIASGGDGEGDDLGGFEVTKTVSGTGASVVEGAEYTVDYSYEADGSAKAGQLTLTAGATGGLTDLPVGTVVTLSEVAARGDGVAYGTPIYAGVGVTDHADGTATFTVSDRTVAIGLENPVTAVPPSEPPVTPDTPSVPDTPAAPGTPNVPSAADGSLAVTGADSSPLLLIAAATLLTGTLLLVVRRVRRRG
jgi:LPXTG-motif cell wall-anchored protein